MREPILKKIKIPALDYCRGIVQYKKVESRFETACGQEEKTALC